VPEDEKMSDKKE
jgi:hypothetical protein